MPIEQTTPDKAKEVLDKDPAAVYVDVRSVPEFVQGHPERAINIPLMHLNPSTNQMTPNGDFPRVAEAVLSKEKTLLVGCKMGGRSQKACEILTRIGFTRVTNVYGGFGGNAEQKGWQALGLPVSRENGDGVSYESLTAAAQNRK